MIKGLKMHSNMVRIAGSSPARNATSTRDVQSPSLIIRGRAILLGSSSFYHKQEAITRLNGLSGVPSIRRHRLLHNFTIRYQGACRIGVEISCLRVYMCMCMNVFFHSPVNNNIRKLDLCLEF